MSQVLNASITGSPYRNYNYEADTSIEHHANELSSFMNSPRTGFGTQSMTDVSGSKPVLQKQERNRRSSLMERIEEKANVESLGHLDRGSANKIATMPNLDKNSKQWTPSNDPKFNIEAELFFKDLMASTANKANILENLDNKENQEKQESKDLVEIKEINENKESDDNKENKENIEKKETQEQQDLTYPPGITIKKPLMIREFGEGNSSKSFDNIMDNDKL
jgi:hypothetical protein